jgi:hypothetical protein
VNDMPLDITDLPGDHYFFIRDRAAEDGLETAYALLEGLRGAGVKPDKDAELRKAIAEQLSYAVGFRIAEEMSGYDVDRLEKEMGCEDAHRRKLREEHDAFFNAAIKAAWNRHPSPQEYADTEIRRDALYHTLQRTGLGDLSLLLGGQDDGLAMANRLLAGESLGNVVTDRRLLDVVKLMPSAMLFAKKRGELEQMLSSYGLNDKQVAAFMGELPYEARAERAIEDIEKKMGITVPENELRDAVQEFALGRDKFEPKFGRFASRLGLSGERAGAARDILYTSLRKASGHVNYAAAVRELAGGRNNVNWVIRGNYTNEQLYAAAHLITNRKLGIKHFHTDTASNANAFVSLKTSTKSISSATLSRLENLIGIEAHITNWDTMSSNSIIYPIRSMPADVMGRLYGILILGRGCRVANRADGVIGYYSLARRSEKEMLDIFELIGSLRNRPFVAKNNKEKDCIGGYVIGVPFQISDMLNQIPDWSFDDTEFTKNALTGWMEDRGRVEGEHCISSVLVRKEDVMRRMSKAAGLNISKTQGSNKLYKPAHVSNPEVVLGPDWRNRLQAHGEPRV